MRNDIAAIIARHAAALLEIDGVEGIGEALCDGSPCIRIYIRDGGVSLPSELEGIPVSAVVTGGFEAQ